MYCLTCHCNLQDDKIQDAINHTLQWIPQVESKYDEPKYYEAFTDIKNQNNLTYFMSFSSQEQEKKIASMNEPRKFGEDLYKMCTKEPLWVEHNLINSIRNSSPDSTVHTRVEYTIKQEAIPDVLEHIVDFIDTVRDSESGIKVYESYQNVQHPNQFIHLAEFQDKKAEQIHKDAPHTKEFADFLYPLCERKPEFIYMAMVGSARR